jgi:hypothetical protein
MWRAPIPGLNVGSLKPLPPMASPSSRIRNQELETSLTRRNATDEIPAAKLLIEWPSQASLVPAKGRRTIDSRSRLSESFNAALMD